MNSGELRDMPTFHDCRFPGESEVYRAARDQLLAAEIALRRQIEAVAALRRELPSGGRIDQDYPFDQVGPAGDDDTAASQVRLSELFAPGKDSLVIYSYMFALGDSPCPSCTSILDSLDGSAPHLEQRVNLAVVAKAPPDEIQRLAHDRGWRHLRLLSSGRTSFNRDYHAERADGRQMPILTVFRKLPDGIHHSWSSELLLVPTEPGQEPRHVDQVWPLWNVLDLTPDGRGTDWHPRLDYR
jgi:predicted dithiol-disulfide oxidoreductase (DUF899 family)